LNCLEHLTLRLISTKALTIADYSSKVGKWQVCFELAASPDPLPDGRLSGRFPELARKSRRMIDLMCQPFQIAS